MKLFLFIIFLFLLNINGRAQFCTLDLLGTEESLTIPFEYEQGFIILKVYLNGLLPLDFIFDTGAENTMLLEKKYGDILGLSYDDDIMLIGADRKTSIPGFISRRVNLKLDKGELFKLDLVVIDEHNINFNNIIGREIDGILGGNMLLGAIVEIDYKRSQITFHNSANFKPKKKFYQQEISIHKQRPFLKSMISVNGDKTSEISLLMDTGAAIHLLIDELSHPDLIMPDTIIDSRIGDGLSGEIGGFLGIISSVELMNNRYDNLPIYFQRYDSLSFSYEEINGLRNGIVGNLLLHRAVIVLDYNRSKLYFKPNRKFTKPFKFNKSGMIVFAIGQEFEEYIVKFVIKDSPADLAGIKTGDFISSINYIPKSFLNMGLINKMISRKEGSKIRLKVRRKEQSFIFKFNLRNKTLLKENIGENSLIY